MLRRLGITLIISVVIYVGVALALIWSQSLSVLEGTETLNFSSLTKKSATPALTNPVPMRDGTTLNVREIGPSNANNMIILLHGSGWHGGAYVQLADRLAQEGVHVLVPDLRGHGENTPSAGDIDYVGQLEDDLADLISARKSAEQRVTLLGHSSGGGLAIRMAAGQHGGFVDQTVLLAPFLKYNAPTARPNSGGWAHPLTRRIIGLVMLNALQIQALNWLPVIQFNFPKAILEGPDGHSATTSYSYSLNTSYAPRFDYLADIAALPQFLLIAGREDEAFKSDAYEPLMSGVTTNGTYTILEAADHFSILNDPRTGAAIVAFLEIGQ